MTTIQHYPRPLPRGVFKTGNARYYARISRAGKTRHEGPFDTVEEAQAARLALEQSSPPPLPVRTPRFTNWDAEYTRQRKALPPFTDMSGIYKRKNGVAIGFTRNRSHVYGGFFTDLTKAVAARDAARAEINQIDLTK